MGQRSFYGWWIVGACFFCNLISIGTSNYAFSLFVKPLEREFGWNRAGIMGGYTLMCLAMAVSSPLIGRAVDRYGPKKVVCLGGIITSIGFAFLSLLDDLPGFYLLYTLIGLGVSAMGQVPLTTVVSNWFKRERGLAIGIMASGIGIGGMVMAPLIGGLIIPRFGWRVAFLFMALIVACTIIPVTLLVIRARSEEERIGHVKRESPESGKGLGDLPVDTWGIPLKTALLTSGFWLIITSFILSQVAAMGVVQSQVPYLTDKGFPVATAAAVLGGMGLLSAFSKVFFGWLCDRINPKFACAIGICLQVMGTSILMLITEASSPIALWIYVVVFGLGVGSWLPVMSMLVSTHFGLISYGAIFGMMSLAQNLGVAVGPLIAGYVYDSTHAYTAAFFLFVSLHVMAMIAVLAVRKPETIRFAEVS
ncbi:MAG: MFS transporter [Desulfobacterales bacterium]|nr:MFS transporter [Desulfobacterales bacterium]